MPFGSDYYDEAYFADPEGKKFEVGGKTHRWGYRNPDGDFRGAEPISRAWKKVFEPGNMLDVGCGRGVFVAYARDVGIEANGFDFSDWAIKHPYEGCSHDWLKVNDATEPWPYGDSSFDLVTLLDFYEHIYEEDLDRVISEMYRVAKQSVFIQLATVDGVNETGFILGKEDEIPWEDGRTWAGHVTVMTLDWWRERLANDDWWFRRDLVEWFRSLVNIVNPSILANWYSIIILTKD